MPTPETHEQAVINLAESSDLPAWALRSLKKYLRRAIATAIANELDRQANDLQRKINSHGAGLPHGCDVGRSNYCEAWRLVVSVLRARAAELRKVE